MATKTTSKTTSNTVTLELENAKSGKKEKMQARIADGFPKVRPIPGQNFIVKSDDLMKLALGKKLDDVVKSAFDQYGFGKADAISFLEKLVISGSAMAKIEE
jgi:hypothetical protein